MLNLRPPSSRCLPHGLPLLSLLAACLPLQRTSPATLSPSSMSSDSPFYCQGDVPPAPAAMAESVGALLVQVTAPEVLPVWGSGASPATAAAVHSIWGEPSGGASPADGGQAHFLAQARLVRLSLHADAAPARQLVPVLSSALALNVRIAPEVAETRLMLGLQDVDLARLLGILREEAGIESTFREGTLFLLPSTSGAVVDVRTVFWPAEGLSAAPEAVLTVFCRDIASPEGSAAVLGSQLYLRDTEEAIQQFRLLYELLRVPHPVD